MLLRVDATQVAAAQHRHAQTDGVVSKINYAACLCGWCFFISTVRLKHEFAMVENELLPFLQSISSIRHGLTPRKFAQYKTVTCMCGSLHAASVTHNRTENCCHQRWVRFTGLENTTGVENQIDHYEKNVDFYLLFQWNPVSGLRFLWLKCYFSLLDWSASLLSCSPKDKTESSCTSYPLVLTWQRRRFGCSALMLRMQSVKTGS